MGEGQNQMGEETLEAAVRNLPLRMIEAEEAERRRIAQEIHDDLGQSLAALKMLVQSSVLPEYLDSTVNRRSYQRVIDYIDEIIEKTRDIATTLRPKMIETVGLTRAVKKLLAGFRQNKGLEIKAQVGQLNDLRFEGDPLNLYRIVQEALTNVYHYAQAARVDVVFRRGKQSLSVVIRDDGKGFSTENAVRDTGYARRHGLSTMHERARLLGGELIIESSPGQGTVIRLTVPVGFQDGSQQEGAA